MKQYPTLMIVIGISTLFACAGTQTGGPGTKNDAVLISPQRNDDMTGIEWHLTKMNPQHLSLQKSITELT